MAAIVLEMQSYSCFPFLFLHVLFFPFLADG